MRRRSVIAGAAVVVVGAFLAPATVAQTVMQPGAWEMETSISATNSGTGQAVKLADNKATLCLTPEFLARQPYFSAALDEQKMKQKGAQCTTSDYKRAGDTASWKMACSTSDGKKVDMTVNNSAAARKLTSRLNQIVTQGAQATPVEILITGTFIGECTAGMPRL